VAVYALGDRTPDIDPDAWVHPDATVVGDVRIGPGASVWPAAVLRGDYGTISVGARTSVQDGTVVHATADKPTTIGADCVVGHLAHLEGCTVEDRCLIGSGSVVLHDAVVRRRLDAVPDGAFEQSVAVYVDNARRYRTDLRRLDG
jgi:carbonic anhydrase/acetyltransferase-like protein (isoleucine patch superfamily)